VVAATTAAAAAAGTWRVLNLRSAASARPPWVSAAAAAPPEAWRAVGAGLRPGRAVPSSASELRDGGARRAAQGAGAGAGMLARVRTGGSAAVCGSGETAGARGRSGRGPAAITSPAGRRWQLPQPTHTASGGRRPEPAGPEAGAVATAATAMLRSSLGGSACSACWVGDGSGTGEHGGGGFRVTASTRSAVAPPAPSNGTRPSSQTLPGATWPSVVASPRPPRPIPRAPRAKRGGQRAVVPSRVPWRHRRHRRDK